MTDATHTVPVRLAERTYNIEIGTGNLADIGRLVAGCCEGASRALVITDDNVEPHAISVGESLAEAAIETDLIIVSAGEPSKSIESATMLWEKLLELGADRKSVVAAVGGGVVGDLAGFIAATFARGLRFVQVPTSLLAQVDSSVGGKVGINLPAAKNMVGAFWQPRAVLIDTRVLTTLPAREYRAGLAEVVKYGVILDADFFAFLEESVDALNARDDEVLRDVVTRCCRIKGDVVQQDEREETGLRAVLNYGHTFCHALEAVTGYATLLHGEAVAIGMLCASRLAERLGRVDAELTDRQQQLLTALGLPTSLPNVDHRQLLTAMYRDKKTEKGRLRFVLPSRMGHVEVVDGVSESDVLAVLDG